MNQKPTDVGGRSLGSRPGKTADPSPRFRRGLGVTAAVLLTALLPRVPLRAAEPPNFAHVQARIFARGATVPAADEAVHDLAFSPDGKTLASCGERWRGSRPDGGDDCVGQVILWDVHTAKARAVITGEGIQTFTRLVFSPDGKTIVSGSYAPDGSNDGTIDFWDVASRRHVRQVKWPGTIVHSFAISGDGRLLAVGGYRGEWVKDARVLRILDMKNGNDLARLEEGVRLVSLAFLADNKLLVVAHSDGRTRVLEVGKWSVRREFRSGGGLSSVAPSPLPGHLAAVTHVRDLVNKIVIWDYVKGESTGALKGETGDVGCMAFSPDGTLLAIGETGLRHDPGTATPASLKICEMRKGMLVTFAENIGPVWRITFSPSGGHLACCSDTGTIRVWTLK